MVVCTTWINIPWVVVLRKGIASNDVTLPQDHYRYHTNSSSRVVVVRVTILGLLVYDVVAASSLWWWFDAATMVVVPYWWMRFVVPLDTDDGLFVPWILRWMMDDDSESPSLKFFGWKFGGGDDSVEPWSLRIDCTLTILHCNDTISAPWYHSGNDFDSHVWLYYVVMMIMIMMMMEDLIGVMDVMMMSVMMMMRNRIGVISVVMGCEP